MYGPVLSVLLMGMLPVAGPPLPNQQTVQLAVSAPLPLTASASTVFSLSRHVSASGMLISDLQSGQLLYGRGATQRRSIGSLTKLMTALLIVEHHTMDEVVTVPTDIKQTTGNVIGLAPGERYTVGDLLSAMLMGSANDAAQTLARFHSATVEAFAKEMNERATVLGLKNTSFATPDGMDHSAQWSTPQDLAWLATFDLRNTEIRSRMSLPETTIQAIGGRSIVVEHTHALLHQQSNVIAGKTGTTDAAGQCLLSIVKEGSREYVVVILGSRERYADMRVVLAALAALLV